MATGLSVVALLIAFVALALALVLYRRPAPEPPEVDQEIPADVRALRSEVAALRLDLDHALRHLSVVRYDAFPDVGGRLSWSAAILDDAGSGVVLTSIRGRNDQRSYAKGVREWTSEQQLSGEEETAIANARPAAG